MSAALLLALAGCGEDPAPKREEEPFAPAWGGWEARFEETWGGDCALADPANYQDPEQTWEIEEDRYGFAVVDEVGYRYPCALDERDFVCELPVIADDFTASGYDIRATYTPTWEGTFADAESLSGLYRVRAECEGEDCGLLDGYGAGFQFPCTAEAGIEAEFLPDG